MCNQYLFFINNLHNLSLDMLENMTTGVAGNLKKINHQVCVCSVSVVCVLCVYTQYTHTLHTQSTHLHTVCSVYAVCTLCVVRRYVCVCMCVCVCVCARAAVFCVRMCMYVGCMYLCTP